MQESKPGGGLGLIILLALLAAGYIFDIEWMKFWGGIGSFIWGAMFVIGFLAGAKQ